LSKDKVCPNCGEQLVKYLTKKGNTLDKGLPRSFIKNYWEFYYCSSCIAKNSKGNNCFAFVGSEVYIWNKSFWFSKNSKEVVEFT